MEIRDTKYVALLQGSGMSAGLHFMSLIFYLDCRRIAAVMVYPWPNGYCGRVQPRRYKFDSREGRIYISLSVLLISRNFC